METTNKDFLTALGREIKIARIRKGVSVQDICELTGMGKRTVYAIENGKTDSKILCYKRIADALKVDMKLFL